MRACEIGNSYKVNPCGRANVTPLNDVRGRFAKLDLTTVCTCGVGTTRGTLDNGGSDHVQRAGGQPDSFQIDRRKGKAQIVRGRINHE